MILGITGGSGSGKSTLLRYAEQAGCLVLDCDEIYHQLLERDGALCSAIASRFPNALENGTLNRKKLGEIVFSDACALEDLNALTHGAVYGEVRRRLAAWSGDAVIDAYALFESGLNALCGCTAAVLAPTEERVRRLVLRDGISPAYAQKRIAAQHSDEWFRSHCDYVLENGGDPAAFAAKSLVFLKKIGIIKENRKGATS